MLHIEADLITTLTGLARAGDLNDLQFLSHAERVTYIAFRLGQKLQLPQGDLEDLILSALVHDLGISTTGEKLKLADLQPQQGMVSAHCRRGYELLKPTKLFGNLAKNVLEHHDYYKPDLRMIPAIIHLADRLDMMIQKDRYYLWQKDDILAYFRSKKGTIFHPDVVEALEGLALIPSFWLDLQYGNYAPIQKELLSFRHMLTLDELEEIAHLVATIVDSKSPFTGTHSQGVTRIAGFLGAAMGMSEHKVRLIRVAGLLHDIGKLAIPDEILMHPGALDKKQRAVMKQHTYHTYYLIGSIGPGVQHIQRWAAYHHERLDGTGYPFALSAPDLEPEARLMAVADITQALLESRPYRDGLSHETVKRILRNNVDANHIDGEITALAIQHLDELSTLV